jgi:hypothetical protein
MARGRGKLGLRRGRNFVIAIGGIVILALVVAAALITTRNKPSDDGDVAGAYRGIQGGFTEEGFPYLGSLDADVVTLHPGNTLHLTISSREPPPVGGVTCGNSRVLRHIWRFLP